MAMETEEKIDMEELAAYSVDEEELEEEVIHEKELGESKLKR